MIYVIQTIYLDDYKGYIKMTRSTSCWGREPEQIAADIIIAQVLHAPIQTVSKLSEEDYICALLFIDHL